MLLKNLRNCLEEEEMLEGGRAAFEGCEKAEEVKRKECEAADRKLTLTGRRCNLEESRTSSPVLYPCGTFAGLADDQDLVTYRQMSDAVRFLLIFPELDSVTKTK